ncbi:MAG: HAD-IA family hydrolase [Muribaculum sp.]|nr:HAD-IA family hydrolase [Muribaculaceae bacterium]MCM1080802.1 HAD-IA family hydrolase [Muribaculum sp.]
MTLLHAIDRYNQQVAPYKFSPRAALFDMDGTLYDSMPNHAHAWHQMISELGIDCTPDEFFLYEGRTGTDTINILWQRAYGRDVEPIKAKELYARKASYFSKMGAPKLIEGAQQTVSALLAYGITTVLVTGSGQPTTLGRLDNDFPGAFPKQRRITAASVTRGKPHPEPFLKAMQLAQAKPWQCIAIDNAPLGVESAHRAGAFTIGIITGPINPDTLYNAGADIVYTSMSDIERDLTNLLANK